MKAKLKSLRTFLFGSKTIGIVLLKSLFILVIPYVYLMLCGLIFDMLLKWYFMTTFIFFSMLALWIAAIVLIINMIGSFVSKSKDVSKLKNRDKAGDKDKEGVSDTEKFTTNPDEESVTSMEETEE